MSELQIIMTYAVFAAVILAIAFNILDLALAGLLGVSVLIVFGILTQGDIINVVKTSGSTFALLFGGMIVARTLTTSGIFEFLGGLFLRKTKGSGKRFLVGLVILVAIPCMFLPNATTVLLLAPIIIRVATVLKIDIVAPLVLTAIISNSAGLLTLVGDPATFLVGTSINMTFTEYLRRVSAGGLMSLLVLMPLLPLVMKDIWKIERTLPDNLKQETFKRPWISVLSLGVLGIMVLLFLFGEFLPTSIVPASASIIACSIALLIIYGAKVEPVANVLRDIDWKTIIFLACMFILVEAFTKTGALRGLSGHMNQWFGSSLLPLAFALIIGVGLASSLLANIPIVAAMILLVKGYLVATQLVPEEALGNFFTEWPAQTIPVFVAMMFGGTLGGNATLIGASANVVSAGISAAHGKPITFAAFLRYGLPIAVCQLAVSAIYVWILYVVVRS
jgi:Na+/H+ antiporter NhaD/arsenite permease-like protein